MPTPDLTVPCTCGHPDGNTNPVGHALDCAAWTHQTGLRPGSLEAQLPRDIGPVTATQANDPSDGAEPAHTPERGADGRTGPQGGEHRPIGDGSGQCICGEFLPCPDAPESPRPDCLRPDTCTTGGPCSPCLAAQGQRPAVDPRQAVYDAVYEHIGASDRVPGDVVTRNAMIWRAVNTGLDALGPTLAELLEYRNAITWGTDCLSCSRMLDSGIRETERAEKAEAERDYMHRVLAVFADADAREGLLWRFTDGELHLSANVSDVFEWGCADAEDITPERLPQLEQAYADLKAIEAEEYVAELYAARIRGERPQGAAYPSTAYTGWRQVAALFDACGPEREIGIGNPKTQPAVG